jgi:oxygen-independent coproporphyrinogen-3 oxidase
MLVYLHIPFCHRICPYCSFYKHTPGQTPIAEFIEAILLEARTRVTALDQAPRTLFLGGGTPSMLSPSHLRALFSGLQRVIDFSTLDEVSLEANPATFDRSKAQLFRELGVTRVSLGIQSFSESVLQTLGREHSPQQARESVEILRAVELPSINIDLMFSIPGQTLEIWRDTLDQAIALAPDHISAYNLTYEEDTAFFQSLLQGEVSEDDYINQEMFYLAHDRLTQAGYIHYETSNYAKSDHKSSHNRGYWRGEQYLGLGPSAVSTLQRTRSKNIADTAKYIELINKIGHAQAEAETLDDEAIRLEHIALGLRTLEGIPLDLLDHDGKQRALELQEHGLLRVDDAHICLSLKGAALVDAIAAELA